MENRKVLEQKKILVTGGTGSMGKVLVQRILSGELGQPKKVIVFSRDEAKQHDMRIAFSQKKVSTDETIYRNFIQTLEFRIGDVRNYADVCSAVSDVDVVVNAAALKQVPACEYFPEQAILTNCVGATNIVRAIRENRTSVETVVGISTDKACKPINVMGMTKALQERVFISANILNPRTRFLCVRYGNVLASRGSVVPLFHHQIESGGPLTITVPEMTRFLLSLHQAVDTVFEALVSGLRGEIYVPNAPSATVMNLAKALIGDRKIEISLTGIRPGEKMHEIMVSEEEALHTVKRGKFYVILPMLPELFSAAQSEQKPLKKEFSSGDTVLDFSGTQELLRQHKLMVGEWNHQVDGELLR